MPLGTQLNLLHLHVRADTPGDPLCICTRPQFVKVQTESSPMVTGSEAGAIVVDNVRQWEKAGPSDIVEAVYEHEDRGEDDQSKPERKIVYQRIV